MYTQWKKPCDFCSEVDQRQQFMSAVKMLLLYLCIFSRMTTCSWDNVIMFYYGLRNVFVFSVNSSHLGWRPHSTDFHKWRSWASSQFRVMRLLMSLIVVIINNQIKLTPVWKEDMLTSYEINKFDFDIICNWTTCKYR